MIGIIGFILKESARIIVGTAMIFPLNLWILDKFWRFAVTVAFAIP